MHVLIFSLGKGLSSHIVIGVRQGREQTASLGMLYKPLLGDIGPNSERALRLLHVKHSGTNTMFPARHEVHYSATRIVTWISVLVGFRLVRSSYHKMQG